jgi:hypothetical protein
LRKYRASARAFALVGLSLFAGDVAIRAPLGGSSETAPFASSLRFEANRGQFAPEVRYLARAGALSVLLSDDAMAFRPAGLAGYSSVTLRLEGSAPVTPVADQQLPTKSHYLRGNDPSRWRTDVPSFAQVRYPALRPGVDLVCHGDGSAFEYDLVLAPGRDVEDLRIFVEGAVALSILPSGALALATSQGDFVQGLPAAYQSREDGGREPVAVSYRLFDSNRIGFEVAEFDRSRALVVDPVLSYSTFLGGTSADSAEAVAVDLRGSVYLAGTALEGFPASAGSLQSKCGGDTDAFVAKLAPDGRSLVFATYLGGSGDDAAASIAVDRDGNTYVAGQTLSPDFPTANAIEPAPCGPQAGFLAMLDTTGSLLVYSTYLGGSEADTATGVTVDALGDAFVTGQTQSPSFPLELPLQSALAGGTDIFVSKLGPGGTTLLYSTYVGGLHDDEGFGIALDAAGDAYVTGATFSLDFPEQGGIPSSGMGGAFLFELDPGGSSFVYSVTLGADVDQGQAVAVDSSGNAFIAGLAASGLYPVLHPLPGAPDPSGTHAFVTKIGASGASMAYSTLLGGSNFDSATGIAVDGSGDAFVTGYTYSSDYPTVAALQTDPVTIVNGIAAFVSEIEPDGSGFIYSTYLGGAGSTYAYGIAMGPGPLAYVVGATGDLDFPTQNGLQPAFASGTAGSQAFLSVLGPGERPLLVVSPSPARVEALGTTTFHAVGGSGGGYVFSLLASPSGGSIDPTSGKYAAGSKGGVLDVALVADSAGTTAAASILVSSPSPSDAGVEAGESGVAEAGVDARPRDTGVSDGSEGTSDATAGSRSDAGTTFTAEGSECSYRPVAATKEPVSVLLTAVLMPLLAVTRRRRRERKDLS